ncbi:hypothetical protein [Arenivirga flava]|uniref:Uncharacterized protein n=1 Tax=Arenivirga flava TaxID=1930060 RepID=A0AA37UQM0_9MICO|nr:hypothetical protein [Arenivirga flava]GMA26799.1 hypothetical protein GCM10025874_00520 [Arenivirga flava]GMA29915.1 hypothetical protein GCM10025874_31680 [Arenivirga flava]GMA29956.1 hypothetical protein GCM10025874_32090 [Arenivirga flava]
MTVENRTLLTEGVNMLDVLTTRELASLIVIVATGLIFVAIPNVRRQIRPSLSELLRAVFNITMLKVFMVVAGAAVISTGLARSIGLWDLNLLKDSIILTTTVVFPLAYRSFKADSGGHLASRLMKETFGLSVLLTFYLDTAPFRS